MNNTELIIEQTRKWITDVVVGCNFCPFASRELRRNSIHYQVVTGVDQKSHIEAFLSECRRLDDNESIETTLLIFPEAVPLFADYLYLLGKAEKAITKNGYEGIYQVASFHPYYIFSGTTEDDAANFTNRSPYPMLHLLREESIEKAIENYPGAENIPEKNIQYTREKGVAYMQALRNACMIKN